MLTEDDINFFSETCLENIGSKGVRKLCADWRSLTAENKRLRGALEKILEAETTNFKAITYDPHVWRDVHQFVENTARQALSQSDKKEGGG
jgi:hypothetical protein